MNNSHSIKESECSNCINQISSPLLMSFIEKSGHSNTCLCSDCIRIYINLTPVRDPTSPKAPSIRRIYSTASIDHTSFEY